MNRADRSRARLPVCSLSKNALALSPIVSCLLCTLDTRQSTVKKTCLRARQTQNELVYAFPIPLSLNDCSLLSSSLREIILLVPAHSHGPFVIAHHCMKASLRRQCIAEMIDATAFMAEFSPSMLNTKEDAREFSRGSIR